MPQAQPDLSFAIEAFRHNGHPTHDGYRGTDGHASTDGDGSRGPSEADGDLVDVAALIAEIEGLRQRLASQPVIEQAKGILMGHYGIDDNTAFQLMRRWSQDSNTKLRHIAELLTESASDGTGIRAAPHQIVQQAVPPPQRGRHAQPNRNNQT